MIAGVVFPSINFKVSINLRRTPLKKSLIIQVLKAASMKMAVFWVVSLYSLVEFCNVSEALIASIIREIVKALMKCLKCR
jgi:hypothetical protein